MADGVECGGSGQRARFGWGALGVIEPDVFFVPSYPRASVRPLRSIRLGTRRADGRFLSGLRRPKGGGLCAGVGGPEPVGVGVLGVRVWVGYPEPERFRGGFLVVAGSEFGVQVVDVVADRF